LSDKYNGCEDIEEQYKLMNLKRMVQEYGIKTFNVSDVNLAKRLVPFILKHVEKTSAINDALDV
jgi:kinetochore-associated protein 1